MTVHFEPHAVHTNRVFQIILAVEPIVFSKHLQYLTVCWQFYDSRRLLYPISIFWCYLSVWVADGYSASRIYPCHVRTVYIHRSGFNPHPRYPFGFGHGLYDCLYRVIDMHNNPTAHTLVLAYACLLYTSPSPRD